MPQRLLFATMGSDNGASRMRMLMDHEAQIGLRTVDLAGNIDMCTTNTSFLTSLSASTRS